MAYPTVELTWQYDTGRDLGAKLNMSADSRMNEVVLMLKNAYIGFPLNPWVVAGGSDGVTAGMDAVDRWLTSGDIIWSDNPDYEAVVAHSWIVLENVAGLQLLIELVGEQDAQARFILSKEGFAGGSVTARPTATDEAVFGIDDISDAVNWQTDLDAFNAANRLHIMHSTDGRNTYMFITGLGAGFFQHAALFECAILIGELTDSPAAITKPYFGIVDRVGVWGAMTFNVDRSYTGCYLPAGPTLSKIVSEHAYLLPTPGGSCWMGVGPTLNKANEISGEWPMQPMFVYNEATASWQGRLRDIWLGAYLPPDATISGTTFPATGTKQFAQFGPFIVPWLDSLGVPVVT